MKITGVMVQYYATCKRELWFFAHGINQNYEDENILIGRWMHKKSFEQEKKSILIDNTISIDFIKRGKELLVFELKKSSKLPIGVRMQILYYLWYLKKKKGINAKGIISYPKEKRREEVVLGEMEQKRIEQALKEIPE
ncbi:MAG: Dna2/Cas4 domain-containing protein, partial [Candidatus Heimdallarchaeota archaeon]|nr:Dna2/Cas4 domain-containing protein [Candidatus Heimdallarchaeota archaeon]